MSTGINDGCAEKFRVIDQTAESNERRITALEKLANMVYGGFAVCGIIWGISEIILKLHGKI